MGGQMMRKVMLCLFLCLWCLSSLYVYGQEKDVTVHFRVKWDGKIIPGITKVSGLRRVTEAIEHRSGGDPSLTKYSPGTTRYVPIIIKRPRSLDKSFEQWANKTFNFGSGLGAEVSLQDFRKDVIIDLYDDTGKVIMAFKVYRCWVAEYIALTDLDSEEDTLAMEVLILHHEGWERDYDIN
jgi:phage tail-like protein